MSLRIWDIIKGKGNIVCKNANHIFAEKVKQYSNKRSLPTCHHCSITGHIRPKCPQLQAPKTKVQRKLPTKTTSGTLPTAAHQAPRHQKKFVPANQSGKPKKNKSIRYKRKPQKPNSNHGWGVVEPDARYANENDRHGQDLQTTSTGQAGMGQQWWDHSPFEGEWTHLVKVKSHHA
jgi:hypothetical protein